MVNIILSILYKYRKVWFPSCDRYHIISVKNGKIQCDCLESIYEGIPCRHELCVYLKSSLEISKLNFNQRWNIDYFQTEDLPPIDEDNLSQEEDGSSEES